MRNKKYLAGAAAITLVASMMAMPLSVGAVTAYDTTNNSAGTGSAVIADGGSSHNAWLTNTISGVTVNGVAGQSVTSYNATEFKKVLEIEDGANIPSVAFEYALTSSGSNIPAEYFTTDVNDPDYNAANAGKIKTLAVFAGIDPEKVVYKLENIDEGTTVFDTASTEDYTSIGTNGAFRVNYVPQNVVLPATGATKRADSNDNVLINNVDGDTYYAIKTVQMDFSAVRFTEPGIYRYFIEESGANQGVVNDYENLDNGEEVTNVTRWRTLDVYVEDATYTDTATMPNTEHNKLKIAGYVMYVGKQTAAPAAGVGVASSANLMEDGLAHTNPSGNGGANGVEVANATKSEGIKNLYKTSDITFKKTVSGNQSSKDKFFKFNISLSAGSTSNVANSDIFVISTDSTMVVDATYNGAEDAPNVATPYSKNAIYTANNATTATVANNTIRYVTGEQLKNGYDFYLQDGQYVTIKGIPNGVGYVLKEYQDDYTPTVRLFSDDNGKTWDNKAGGTNGNVIDAPVIELADPNGNIAGALVAPQNMAKIEDSEITDNVYATFNNDRNGTIPTGVVLSTIVPVGVGVVFIGGLVALSVNKKRRKNNSEQ